MGAWTNWQTDVRKEGRKRRFSRTLKAEVQSLIVAVALSSEKRKKKKVLRDVVTVPVKRIGGDTEGNRSVCLSGCRE